MNAGLQGHQRIQEPDERTCLPGASNPFERTQFMKYFTAKNENSG